MSFPVSRTEKYIDGVLVGQVAHSYDNENGKNEFCIFDLEVVPEHRGKGIGTKLLEETLENIQRFIKYNGITSQVTIALSVEISNPEHKRLLEFYNKRGFELQSYYLTKQGENNEQ